MPILSWILDKKSLETEFLIAICRHTGDIWRSKTLFLSIIYLRSSIVLAFLNAAYPVCYCNIQFMLSKVQNYARHINSKSFVYSSNRLHITCMDDMGLVVRKPDFVASEQQKHRQACTSTQSDHHLCYSLSGKYNYSKTCLKQPDSKIEKKNKCYNDKW